MPLRMGAPRPALTGATGWINGAPADAALAGAPVLVHFWSVSCHICHENMPALARWRQEFVPAGVRFMSVHLPRQESDLDVDAVRARVAEFAISEPCAVDNARAIADAFQNRVVPAYYLFDREGALRARTAGPAGLAMFEAALRRQTSRNGLPSLGVS